MARHLRKVDFKYAINSLFSHFTKEELLYAIADYTKQKTPIYVAKVGDTYTPLNTFNAYPKAAKIITPLHKDYIMLNNKMVTRLITQRLDNKPTGVHSDIVFHGPDGPELLYNLLDKYK